MTVKFVTKVQRWMGLDSDTKPTSPPVGSTFYETNTGQDFIYNGSNWVEDLRLMKAVQQALGE